MKTKNIVLLIVLILLFCECRNTNSNKKDELEEAIANTKKFEEIFENKSKIINTKNSTELVTIALDIQTHIGWPVSVQDTQRLLVAIDFLNQALYLDSLNRSAYNSKVKILMSMQLWNKSLEVIDEWLSKGKPLYYDYMLKGFVYETIDLNDSSLASFQEALKLFEVSGYVKDDVKNQVQKAIIIAFLYGEQNGIEEIDNIIQNTESTYAIQVKESVITNFNKKEYVNEYVFRKPTELQSNTISDVN